MTRMSNVFELPVSIAGVTQMEKGSGYDEAKAAERAINTHDKLIELLCYAVKHATIDTTSHEQMKWFIDAFELLEGEL